MSQPGSWRGAPCTVKVKVAWGGHLGLLLQLGCCGGGAGLAWLIPRAVRTLAGVQEAMPLTLLCTQSPELPAVVGPAGKAPV